MGIITLISYLTARKGYKFVFTKPATECLNCRLKAVCVDKLKVGHIYEVTKVYEIRNKCPINEYVVTVEVEESPIDIAIDRKLAVDGMVINYRRRGCDKLDCSNYPYCVPKLVTEPVKAKVEGILREIECPKDLKLSLVKVKILEVIK